MKKLYEDDSLTLHTDLYQINMMKTYWETGRADRSTGLTNNLISSFFLLNDSSSCKDIKVAD